MRRGLSCAVVRVSNRSVDPFLLRAWLFLRNRGSRRKVQAPSSKKSPFLGKDRVPREDVIFCHDLSRNVTICHFLSRFVTICHSVIFRHKLSRSVTSCHDRSFCVTNRHSALRHKLSRSVIRTCVKDCRFMSRRSGSIARPIRILSRRNYVFFCLFVGDIS